MDVHLVFHYWRSHVQWHHISFFISFRTLRAIACCPMKAKWTNSRMTEIDSLNWSTRPAPQYRYMPITNSNFKYTSPCRLLPFYIVFNQESITLLEIRLLHLGPPSLQMFLKDIEIFLLRDAVIFILVSGSERFFAEWVAEVPQPVHLPRDPSGLHRGFQEGKCHSEYINKAS